MFLLSSSFSLFFSIGYGISYWNNFQPCDILILYCWHMDAKKMQHEFSGRNQTNQAAVLHDPGRLCQRSTSGIFYSEQMGRWKGEAQFFRHETY